MRSFSAKTIGILAVFAAFGCLFSQAQACTGIMFSVTPKQVAGADRFAFQARTMEFGPDVTGWRLVAIPRNHSYTGCRMNTCGDGVKGLKWTTNYLHVGMSPARPGLGVIDEVTDGINEKGLSCGGFYHMGYESYSKNPRNGKAIANTDFVSWVLGRFASVAEVRKALESKTVDVAPFTLKNRKGQLLCTADTCPQLHYAVTDATGASIVIEFARGEARIYDSIGVITNDPTYDWHMTNMKNYIGLQALSREYALFNSKRFDKLGNGTGAIGLPGDFTPPSRFVRAMFFLNTAMPLAIEPDEAVARAFRILNQFDIPEGSIIAASPTGKGQIQDSTAWTSLSDLKRKRYYFHTQTSRTIRMIELDRLPKDALVIQELPAGETVLDVSTTFGPPPAK